MSTWIGPVREAAFACDSARFRVTAAARWQSVSVHSGPRSWVQEVGIAVPCGGTDAFRGDIGTACWERRCPDKNKLVLSAR